MIHEQTLGKHWSEPKKINSQPIKTAGVGKRGGGVENRDGIHESTISLRDMHDVQGMYQREKA
jgi:hypothetical protein